MTEILDSYADGPLLSTDHKLWNAFNSYDIVYDNSPWRPGRDMSFSAEVPSEEDERRLKNNLATRIMSNGVEVVVKDHNSESRSPATFMKVLSASANFNPTTVRNKERYSFDSGEQRKTKKTFSSLRIPSLPESKSPSNKSLVSSSVATVFNHRHLTASFPLQQLMQHNYIIKTCLTTYTYLTTVIQDKKSAVATFETIISVVTTESLTKVFGTNLLDIRPTKTKYMEIKTVQPTAHKDDFLENSAFVKLQKRIDGLQDEDLDTNYDIIQPSEISYHAVGCSKTSCPCTHVKTESIDRVKTKYTSTMKHKNDPTVAPIKRIALKSTKLASTKYEELSPTRKQTMDKNTDYGPYKYETTKLPPSEKVVEKYTEVINDYSEEIETSNVEESELLTNEEAPPTNTDKLSENKKPDKIKEKPQKPNKNKFVVADLLKLGSLGIKGLSQLAPVIEKMTGGFIKRQETNKTTTTTTTLKPVTKLTPYNVNKRVDANEPDKKTETKLKNFPIYIPVDELETSESQHIYSNVTLHQNLAWANEHKHPKAHYGFSKIVHESPLVNGGIPISPGEIITANSDVIVGKPAVGGPLTLAASGIKLQSQSKPTSYDSEVASNEPFLINKRPPKPESHSMPKNDDSFDLRPPGLPQLRQRPPHEASRRPILPLKMQNAPGHNIHHSTPNYHTQESNQLHSTQNYYTPGPNQHHLSPNYQNQYRVQRPANDQNALSGSLQLSNTFFENGGPALLDYTPALNKPNEILNQDLHEHRGNLKADDAISDSNPSSSENIDTRVRNDGDFSVSSQLFSESASKPFLVDIQPSRVANVLIPHGSSTALIFAGSSEPHKTGDYIDDPLPYPEPGYFGSFSIDAPQMTMVHNVAPSIIHEPHAPRKPIISDSQNQMPHSHLPSPKVPSHLGNDFRYKYKKNNKRPNVDFTIPPPISNQETHIQVGPHIASFNPDVYSHNDFEKYKNVNDAKKAIDKEYENHLAVPPPPPPKGHFNSDVKPGPNNRPYNQRPVFHTKPIQDMKVFLNIQHPVPRPSNLHHPQQDSLPPKVTSEIYFATAASPNDPKVPTYTMNIPASTERTPFNENTNTNHGKPDNINFIFGPQQSSSFQPYQNDYVNPITPKNPDGKFELSQPQLNENDNVYSITLNTQTNVGNSNTRPDKILGSSVAVPIRTTFGNLTGIDGTGIPIGTNVAIKVDGNPVSFQRFNFNNQHEPPIVYDEHGQAPDIIIGDSRWNFSPNSPSRPNEFETHTENHKTFNDTFSQPNEIPQQKINVQIVSNQYINSHANFPMVHESSTTSSVQESAIKPVTEEIEDVVKIDQKRPSKYTPNIPTNSHGWYSSVPIKNVNSNTFANVHKIKTDTTTRKIIPLSHAYNLDNAPEFGEKIPSVGVPPTGLWSQKDIPLLQDKDKQYKIPSKDTSEPDDFMGPPPLTTQPYNPAYIPSNFGASKQPAYDIPIRDDNYETEKHPTTSEKVKPVYENSDEIYDGGSEEINSEVEVSLESMKIPVISTMDDKKPTYFSTTPLTLLQDEVYESLDVDTRENEDITVPNSYTGTQTEKPFLGGDYKGQKTPSQFSTQRPFDYTSNNNMRPRPFEVNAHTLSFSDSPNPHWQINHLIENMTTPQDNGHTKFFLNIGEEMTQSTTKTPIDFTSKSTEVYTKTTQEIFKIKPHRPIFSLKQNNSHPRNESTNIITSNIQISDRKPLTVINATKEENTSTLPAFTINSIYTDGNNYSVTEIINLSPPPPTMDYSFKPSSSDETIMGMSPPPARTPMVPRAPPSRTPAPQRIPPSRPTLPPRTQPPYRNKPPRTLPPRTTPNRTVPPRILTKEKPKDEISTYRPTYDILKNKPKRPTYNKDRLPSHLMPPPTEPPTPYIHEPSISIPVQDFVGPPVSNVVFPTLISSGWLTSSSVDFPSGPHGGYSPSSVQFSFTPSSTYDNVVIPEQIITPKPVYEGTPVLIPDINENEHKVFSITLNDTRYETTTKFTTHSINETPSSAQDSYGDESNVSQEETSSSESTKINVIPLNSKNRTTYKPNEHKHVSVSKVRLPIKPSVVIRPTRTLSKTETPQPTKILPPRKKLSNLYSPVSRIPPVYRPAIVESSESFIDEDFIVPTEVLKEVLPSSNAESVIPLVKKTILIQPIIPTSINDVIPEIKPTHHAGNEVKISDQVIPTKTEFKITSITLTKTLSEPPKTVSTTRFLNLTHTLTVTHTKTSLVSLSAGDITQTLILTNTHTSTIIDVVTEIHTQVQPTTIVETVTKHIPIVQATPVIEAPTKTKIPALDDITISSEEDNLIINPENETTDNIQKLDKDEENESFLIVMNKSQSGGTSPPVHTDIDPSDYDGVTRNEEVNSNGVSQVLFGEILLAGTPYLETTNVVKSTGTGYSKECQPDCKASRNERCQRIDGLMKCVCRPGFARMFPDRPCKPTYTYSVKLALSRQGKERLQYHQTLSNNGSKEYHNLALATHEGINRMVMQSDLRDVFHGIHINGFHPVEVPTVSEDHYTGVANEFYVQLSDNAHETRLKEVIEKYLRTNNYSLGGTDVFASEELLDQLQVSDFDECHSVQFHDCSEHAQCFNLRGTYTCSCKEGFADMSVNALYPGRICSSEQVGCERCNYHGACYTRDDKRVLCECFQWYAGSSCQVNLKVILISLTTVGAALMLILVVCGVLACSRRPRRRPHPAAHPQRSIVASCIQSVPSLHQGAMASSKHRGTQDRRALIADSARTDSGDTSSVQNMSLPYMPSKKVSGASSKSGKKSGIPDPPTEKAPQPCVMIPRARLHQNSRDCRDSGGASRKPSMELSTEAKLISYLESGSNSNDEMMRRKHSEESSYSLSKERHSKHNAAGALVSAGFKVSTTVKPDDSIGVDDTSSVNKEMLERQLSHYDAMRKAYSQDDISEWTDAERRIGELTLSEARSVGGTLPASTGRAASSTRMTNQEAHTMAERDLGSTFLLPHVHLYKPELGSDVSEFDSL